MTSPLRRSFPKVLAQALSPVLIDLVYQEVTQVPIDTSKPWEGTTEKVITHACRGFVDSFSRFEIAQSLVQAGDLKVTITADSLDVTPSEKGRIVVDGQTLSIVSVRSDPLGATWEVQARG